MSQTGQSRKEIEWDYFTVNDYRGEGAQAELSRKSRCVFLFHIAHNELATIGSKAPKQDNDFHTERTTGAENFNLVHREMPLNTLMEHSDRYGRYVAGCRDSLSLNGADALLKKSS